MNALMEEVHVMMIENVQYISETETWTNLSASGRIADQRGKKNVNEGEVQSANVIANVKADGGDGRVTRDLLERVALENRLVSANGHEERGMLSDDEAMKDVISMRGSIDQCVKRSSYSFCLMLVSLSVVGCINTCGSIPLPASSSSWTFKSVHPPVWMLGIVIPQAFVIVVGGYRNDITPSANASA
jgi:hypothetical protein